MNQLISAQNATAQTLSLLLLNFRLYAVARPDDLRLTLRHAGNEWTLTPSSVTELPLAAPPPADPEAAPAKVWGCRFEALPAVDVPSGGQFEVLLESAGDFVEAPWGWSESEYWSRLEAEPFEIPEAGTGQLGAVEYWQLLWQPQSDGSVVAYADLEVMARTGTRTVSLLPSAGQDLRATLVPDSGGGL